MNIAIFTDTFAPDVNGVAKTLKHYTAFLKKNGMKHRIFAPKATKGIKDSEYLLSSNSFPLLFYPESRIALPKMTSIKKELLDFNPDIIHVATPFSMGLVGRYYSKKLNIPIVGSYHTDFDKYLEHYHLQFLTNLLWKYSTWFHRPLEKIFVPSKDTEKRLERRNFNNLSIWPRGIDGTIFNRDYKQDQVRMKYKIKEKNILLYVGRVAAEKDVELLPEIANRLPKYIRNDVHWLIVGDGPRKERLEKIAPPNMTFTGYIEGEDLAKIYASADLFVTPSTSETFGNVVLESLACGTPVIGADAGGVRTIIQDGQTGLLCEEKNVEEFAENIIRLLKNDQLRTEMGERGFHYAQSQSWDAIFHSLIEECYQVLHFQSYKEQELA